MTNYDFQFTDKDTLPDLPSELLLLALKDLEACELSDKYTIDMSTWYLQRLYTDPIDDREFKQKCQVCMAGAILAQTLKIDTVGFVGPYTSGFKSTLTKKLLAINCANYGDFEEMLDVLGIVKKVKFDGLVMPPYARDPVKFKSVLRQVIFILKDNNL